MRDPQRIDELLTLLREVWVKVPDWRLTQLIHNAIEPEPPSSEIFFVEDTELMDMLRRMSKGLDRMEMDRPQ